MRPVRRLLPAFAALLVLGVLPGAVAQQPLQRAPGLALLGLGNLATDLVVVDGAYQGGIGVYLTLQNIGPVPAEDITVSLTPPPGFTIVEEPPFTVYPAPLQPTHQVALRWTLAPPDPPLPVTTDVEYTIEIASSTYDTLTHVQRVRLPGVGSVGLPTSTFALLSYQEVLLWDGASLADITGNLSWPFSIVEGAAWEGDLYVAGYDSDVDPSLTRVFRHDGAGSWTEVGTFNSGLGEYPRQLLVHQGELHLLFSVDGDPDVAGDEFTSMYRFDDPGWTSVGGVNGTAPAALSTAVGGPPDRMVMFSYLDHIVPAVPWRYVGAGGPQDGSASGEVARWVTDFAEVSGTVYGIDPTPGVLVASADSSTWVGTTVLDEFTYPQAVEGAGGVLWVATGQDVTDGPLGYPQLVTYDGSSFTTEWRGGFSDGGRVFQDIVYDGEFLLLAGERLYYTPDVPGEVALYAIPGYSTEGWVEEIVLMSPGGAADLGYTVGTPTELGVVGLEYEGNPFDVTMNVRNDGIGPANEVTARLELGPQFELVEGENPRDLGTIAGGTAPFEVTWKVRAKNQMATTTAGFTAFLEAANDATQPLTIDVVLPSLRPTPLTLTLTRIVEIDDPDGGIGGAGDYQATVVMNGIAQDSPNQQTGSEVEPFWTFHQLVAEGVPAEIEVIVEDNDGGTAVQQIDVSPVAGETSVKLAYNHVTDSWASPGSPANSRVFKGSGDAPDSVLMFEISTLSTDGDKDGDGLLDGWEQRGLDWYNGSGITKVDLPAMGADPGYRDVFVELDYMEPSGSATHSLVPSAVGLERVRQAFKDEKINLHVDFGVDSRTCYSNGGCFRFGSHSEAGDGDAFGLVKYDDNLELFSEFRTEKAIHFDDSRRWVFHYAINGDRGWYWELFKKNVGGRSDGIPGSDFAVTSGGFDPSNTFNAMQWSGIFMHELGHNLGLRHGGNENANDKPNYLSTMNYLYDTELSAAAYAGPGGIPLGGGRVFDFSRGTAATLDERDLDETVGVTGPTDRFGIVVPYHIRGRLFCNDRDPRDLGATVGQPIDWDGCGTTYTTGVTQNINNDLAVGLLRDHDDWGNIVFDGENIGGDADAEIDPEPVVEDPYEVEEPGQFPYSVKTGLDGPVFVQSVATYTAIIINFGAATDTYIVEAKGDWLTSSLPATVTLAPGERVELPLQVGVPTGTPNGDSTRLSVVVYGSGGTFGESTVDVFAVADPAHPPFQLGAAVYPKHGVGLVDSSSGQWYLRGSDSFYFGDPGDIPMTGDWDCDGIDTPGLYRQSDGFVYLRNSNTQGIADIRFFFGNPGDEPLAGDFNGDGCDTVSIYRPSEGRVFVINRIGANDGGLGAAQTDYYFGNVGDKPFIGDFDGDGVDTVGLHRESTGLVYFRNSHTQGIADAQFVYGDPNDRLVGGDWTGNGASSPGIFRPSNAQFFLIHDNVAGNADEVFPYGESPWLPVAGVFSKPS